MLFPSGSSTLFENTYQKEIGPTARQIGGQIPRVTDRGGLIKQRGKFPEKAAEQDKQHGGKSTQGPSTGKGQQEVGEDQYDQPRENIVKIADDEKVECADGKRFEKIQITEIEKPHPGKRGQVERELPP